MSQSKKALTVITGYILIMLFSSSPDLVIAQQSTNSIQQLIDSGKRSPQQAQQAKEALEKGTLDPETVDQLQKEGKLGTLTPAEIEAGKEMIERVRKEALKKLPEPIQKKGEEKAPPQTEEEYFKKTFAMDEPALRIYGHDLFAQAPSTFAPVTAIPVSNDYIIEPGDEIKVLMWGRLDAEYTLDVDSEGVISFPKVGPLIVAGLTYGELKELIKRKAGAITGVNVHISMGQLRTIQVFVLGEVKSPGLFTVGSLAAIGNALLSSGGPTTLGTLRNIQLKRHGKVISTVDVYDFLFKGDISKDIRLMPGDVIFVPQVGPMVSVSGNVRRPAIYELEDDRTLQTALALAGGLTPRAYNQRIQIERYFKNKVQIILDISYEELQEKKPILLQDGDFIRVFSILPSTANAVYLYGNVVRPGQYAHKPGIHLIDILPNLDSLSKDTYFDYALIKRYRQKDMKAELMPFDLGRLLLAKDDRQNFTLQPLDEIYIFSKRMFEDKPTASVEGEVRRPGRYAIGKMKIKDLIFMAGNLTRDAYLELGHLYRTDPKTMAVSMRVFNLGKALEGNPEHNIVLQDMDRIVIHSVWEYVQRYNVSIRGMVNKPGNYPYAANMTIRDLILVGGNIKDSAYLERAELVRFEITDGKQVRTSVLNFNVQQALGKDPVHNMKLKPLDVISIKQIPEWGETKRVTITGEVHFPGKYEIRRDERLSSVIERAVGFTDLAYFRGAVFTRESVREIQQRRLVDMIEKLRFEVDRAGSQEAQAILSEEDLAAQKQYVASQEGLMRRLEAVRASGRVVIALTPMAVFKGSDSDLVLEDGDELQISQKSDTINVLGEVYNPTSLIFEEENPTLGYYLEKTGGSTENAEKKQMYLVRADGTVISKKATTGFWGSGFEKTHLYPGDTILVPQKVVYPHALRDWKEMTQIIANLAIAAGVVVALF